MEQLYVFEALPPDWTTFLDPCSFLALQSSSAGPFLNDRSIELYWSSICKCHLERFINADSSCTVELRFDVDVDMLLQQGACSSEAESSFMPTLLLQRHWKCLFRELVGGAVQAYAAHGRSCMSEKDPDQNLGTEAVAEQSEPEEEEEDLYPLYPADRLRPGSLRTTAGNELRCTLEEFRFPLLPDAKATPAVHCANLLREVVFSEDVFARCTFCHLASPLGGDRCVMAKHPLPWQGAVAAFPEEPRPQLPQMLNRRKPAWPWRIARRACTYYEVEIKRPADRVVPARDLPGAHCVSVGLALASIPMRGLCRQQAGWNPHSWALHGDDGQMYHGHGQGQRFNPLWISSCQGGTADGYSADASRNDSEKHQGRGRMPKFSVGDVIGCGVCKLDTPGELGIFFALNGELLGVCFPVFSTVEPRFYPCVGIDTPWDLSFNFGCEPFRLDLNMLRNLKHVYSPRYAAARCVDVSNRVMEFPISHWPSKALEAQELSLDDSDDSGHESFDCEHADGQDSTSTYTESPGSDAGPLVFDR